MLDTLFTSGSPDFPKFQTKNNAYKNPEQLQVVNYISWKEII
jgi:hypothetical protein